MLRKGRFSTFSYEAVHQKARTPNRPEYSFITGRKDKSSTSCHYTCIVIAEVESNQKEVYWIINSSPRPANVAVPVDLPRISSWATQSLLAHPGLWLTSWPVVVRIGWLKIYSSKVCSSVVVLTGNGFIRASLWGWGNKMARTNRQRAAETKTGTKIEKWTEWGILASTRHIS